MNVDSHSHHSQVAEDTGKSTYLYIVFIVGGILLMRYYLTKNA